MSRRPAPSIFDADSMSVDDLKTKVMTPEPLVEAEPRRVGRPAKTTTKAKPTPFYLHPAVKEVLRDIAYHNRCKEHDLFVEGLEHVLKSRSYPTIAEIIAKAERDGEA
ncbi:hypothetical protein MKK63_16795 [Methylobacterium sp. J-088]|uniref:hypothetical protein n=1 Tax=Methylobacterium sp. J-088 TaxID=2836664 RepID=UPI001FBB3C2F|nr:hypothetical protein [Methylobacterium sp. J-088]MCJ2064359.1 hypothetical protein [Methylobacterium sp. J-088]